MVSRRAAALLLAIVATLATAVPVRPQTQTLAITRVTVVDVADGRLIPNSTVAITGGKIKVWKDAAGKLQAGWGPIRTVIPATVERAK